MKNFFVILVCISISSSFAQKPVGVWKKIDILKNGKIIEHVLIFTENYHVNTTYNLTTGEFLNTSGGSWKSLDNTITESIEFNTHDSTLVGNDLNYKFEINGAKLKVNDKVFSKIIDFDDDTLEGAWLISGRKSDGKFSIRDINKPRKTMKILYDNHFQWIAYSTKTKSVIASGGGTYTAKNGKYTENIKFFSRNKTKTGMSLSFDYELIHNKWHHKGFSSKGKPFYEIWTLRD